MNSKATLLQDLRVYPEKIRLYDRLYTYRGISVCFNGSAAYYLKNLPTYIQILAHPFYRFTRSEAWLLCHYRYMPDYLKGKITTVINFYITHEDLFWEKINDGLIKIQ